MLVAMGYGEGLCRAALVATKNKGVPEAFEWISSNEHAYAESANTAASVAEEQPSAAASSSGNNGGKKKKPRLIPLELQRLFVQLQFLEQRSISTERKRIEQFPYWMWLTMVILALELTKRGFNWQSFDGRVQHDAHELNRLLIDALEKSLVKTSGENICKDIYGGAFRHLISVLSNP
jgi:uncharacterized UBP type Zn finger protein